MSPKIRYVRGMARTDIAARTLPGFRLRSVFIALPVRMGCVPCGALVLVFKLRPDQPFAIIVVELRFRLIQRRDPPVRPNASMARTDDGDAPCHLRFGGAARSS
jgi:hypothetical protein